MSKPTKRELLEEVETLREAIANRGGNVMTHCNLTYSPPQETIELLRALCGAAEANARAIERAAVALKPPLSMVSFGGE